MPPDVDNKALARQKRRRTRYVFHSSSSISTARVPLARRVGTCLLAGDFGLPRDKRCLDTASQLTTTSCSKEDEDVLKAEYIKNPKPDKAARLHIVSKVALGEKEVQVCPRVVSHVTRLRAILICMRFPRFGFKVSCTCSALLYNTAFLFGGPLVQQRLKRDQYIEIARPSTGNLS